MPPPIPESARLERLIREDWGRALAGLVKVLGDFALAEDALQDAVVAALAAWPDAGIPRSPRAWLVTVARRKAIDRLRRDAAFNARADQIRMDIEERAGSEEPGEVPDKRLELIFTCCHPALEEKSRIALTLRALGGLSTEAIAAAFLDKTATMAARLTRAKAKIAAAGVPYRVPDATDLPERLSAVCRVIYLIFNEGYRASAGPDLIREDLADEAIRLGRILHGLLPNEGEVAGLLALMLLGDSRRHARQDSQGTMIALEDQSRQRWDKGRIAEGMVALDRAFVLPPAGPYTIQAAIQALHSRAPDFASTDWAQIAALYWALGKAQPGPVVEINRAVALSYADGPQTAIAVLDRVAQAHRIDAYQPYFAARADILARLERHAEATVAYDRAILLAASEAERAFLVKRRSASERR